ncbi:MAG: hypothetical protein J2P47_02270 [Acetobacteraceae bacterium]|nr:hypothetical protein [Acetobacteraceae bacterium]
MVWRDSVADPSCLRRTSNRGFKAGNIRAFCESLGDDYDLMLPLDAASLMTGPATKERAADPESSGSRASALPSGFVTMSGPIACRVQMRRRRSSPVRSRRFPHATA